MAQAALHLRLRSISGDAPEALNRPFLLATNSCRAFHSKVHSKPEDLGLFDPVLFYVFELKIL